MSNALIQAVQADLRTMQQSGLESVASAAAPDNGTLVCGGGFADSLRDAVRGTDEKERIATDKMAAVDSGRSDDLVGAMLASQEASLSFSMLMQVRNKVMGAVEDLVKLPL